MTQSAAKVVFGKLNQTCSVVFSIVIAIGVHILVGVLAVTLKRIGESKGDLPNWRTLLWVAAQGEPRWRAFERSGDYWDSKLREIQPENLGVVWGKSRRGHVFQSSTRTN